MARKRSRKREHWDSLPITDKAFKPYATALGQIALAWNGLHSKMALFFCSLMGGGYSNQYLAIWHAIKNDRAQRAILEAAAKGSRQYAEYESDFGKKMYADVHWLNGQATVIEDARDDALHSPLWGYPAVPGRAAIIAPITGLGHTRAKKLADAKRGLLTEFRWCRDSALVLTDFVRDMDDCLTGYKQTPWPQKPSLPSRGQTSPAIRPAK